MSELPALGIPSLERSVALDLTHPEGRDLVRAHMARGHTVVLSSSALTVTPPICRR